MLWGALIILLGLLSFIGGVVLLVGKLIDEHIVFRIGKGILMFFGIPLLLMVTLLSWSEYSSWNHTRIPANNFKDVFDCSPPTDVTDIQSNFGSSWDSMSLYLKFRVPPATLMRLCATKYTQVNQITPFDSNGMPEWWHPKINKNTTIFVRATKNGNFSSEKEFILYDRPTQTAYFCYEGID